VNAPWQKRGPSQNLHGQEKKKIQKPGPTRVEGNPVKTKKGVQKSRRAKIRREREKPDGLGRGGAGGQGNGMLHILGGGGDGVIHTREGKMKKEGGTYMGRGVPSGWGWGGSPEVYASTACVRGVLKGAKGQKQR